MNKYDINGEALPSSLDNLVFTDGDRVLSDAEVEALLRTLEGSDV
jgi:hypothetical protein